MPTPLIDSYHDLCEGFSEEFSRNRRLHGDRIQCRRGCSDCCHQLFQITEIEAAEIARGLAAMAPETVAELRERALPYLEARRALVTAKGEPEAWGSLPTKGTRLPCPALKDGACQIYEYRPLICRKFGIPLYNPDRPGRIYACELNFQDGEEILDGQLIRIQSRLHQDWKALQAAWNDAGLRRDPEPLTVARVIGEGFTV